MDRGGTAIVGPRVLRLRQYCGTQFQRPRPDRAEPTLKPTSGMGRGFDFDPQLVLSLEKRRFNIIH